MEEKQTKPRPPRMAANVPRSARIVVNSNKPETWRTLKKESDKKSNATLEHGVSAVNNAKKVHDTTRQINTEIHRTTETAHNGVSKAVATAKKTKDEPGKIKIGAKSYSKAPKIAGQIAKDVEKDLKSQEDSGMATLGYGVSAVNNAKKVYETAHIINTEIHRTIETVHNGVSKAVATAKEIEDIPRKIKTGETTVREIRNHVVKSTLKSSVKATTYVAKAPGKVVKKVGSYGLNYAADSMAHSEDDATRMMGKTVKTMQYVYRIRQREKKKAYVAKASNPAPKAAGISVKKKSESGKSIAKAENSKRTANYSKALKTAQQKQRTAAFKKQWSKSVKGKAVTAIQKAGGSATAAITKAAAAAGKDIIIPVVLALLAVLLVLMIIIGAAGVISVIFSPFLSDDSGNQVDESAWLTTKITASRAELIQDIKDTYNSNLIANGGEYHYVRFYNSITETEVVLDDTNIDTSIYTVLEYQQFIQPIFHTLMLSEYELQASESQMTDLYDEIWDKISVIKTEPLPMEYCQMTRTDNPDGTYVINPVKENDGNVHADPSTCPNMSAIQYHADDATKSLCSCDSYYYSCNTHKGTKNCSHANCSGCSKGDLDCTTEHEHSDSCYKWTCDHKCTEWSKTNSGCYNTVDHGQKMSSACTDSTKHLECSGYYICNGHKILFLTVELKEFDELLQIYYLNRINELEAKATLTEEEKKELRDLKQYYEVCVEYIKVLVEEFGLGNATIVTLEGVELTPLTAYACSFVGKPYIWGGTDPNNGADCSGFVQYVYAHFGTTLPRVSKDQVKEGSTVGSITDAEPGDLIFYSKTGTDDGVYHVAIYLGNNKIVHASNSKPYPSGGIKVGYVYGTIYKIKHI